MDEGTWEHLKSACSNGSPAGENCEYQPAFLELLGLASPRAEIQVGNAVIAARLPDWPAILERSLHLSQQTRDLRIGVLLVESLTQRDGWSGLAAGLEIINHWTSALWFDVWPELDRDEHDDPTARLSALSHLLSDQFLQRTLYQLPLAEHPSLGTLRLRDTLAIIKGKKEVVRELTAAELQAFFKESEPLTLAMRLRDVDRCCDAVEMLDQFLNNQPGSEGWSAGRLITLLQRGRELLMTNLAGHQRFDSLVATSSDEQPAANTRSPKENTDSTTLPPVATGSMAQATTTANPATLAWLDQENKGEVALPVAGGNVASICPLQIGSRSEATAAIDAVCAYFQSHEPASPVPLLLQRAKRLVSMNFIELMHELAPTEALQLLRQLHVVDRAG